MLTFFLYFFWPVMSKVACLCRICYITANWCCFFVLFFLSMTHIAFGYYMQVYDVMDMCTYLSAGMFYFHIIQVHFCCFVVFFLPVSDKQLFFAEYCTKSLHFCHTFFDRSCKKPLYRVEYITKLQTFLVFVCRSVINCCILSNMSHNESFLLFFFACQW